MHAPTQVDQKLAQAQKRHAGDPQRAEIITRARRFKSSWFELAEVLTACQKDQLYTKWGYHSFEDYFRKELRLKTATVNKLVGSYCYLKKEAPEVLQRDGVVEQIPSAESVQYLRKSAELCAEGKIAAEVHEQVRAAVVDDGLSPKLLDRWFRPVLFPEAEIERVAKQRRDAARTANQLVTRLADLRGALPEGVLSQASAALDQLLSVLLNREGGDGPPAAPAAVVGSGAREPAPPADQVELGLSERAVDTAQLGAEQEADEADQTEPQEPDAPNKRVADAHRIAVIYLCSLDQSSDPAAVGRLRKSLVWHLRILSAQNLTALRFAIPAGKWQLILDAAETDPLARRNLDQALGPQGWARHAPLAARRSSHSAGSSAAA
ncbi:MAG TPA: hypothetical protein PLW65_18015 [Pseudomonadota bacterium]|nr:hypothetical protein [Pseudomonadota bacterium]